MATVIKRTVSDATLGALGQVVTEPYNLIKIMWESATSYMSTGPQTVFQGNTYIESGARMGRFSWDSEGNQKGNIFLFNQENTASALVLNNTVADTPIEIYQTDRDGEVQPVAIVVGVLDSPDTIGLDEVGLRVTTSGSRTTLIPNEYHTLSNGFNFLPRAGTIIMWAGEKFELQNEGR